MVSCIAFNNGIESDLKLLRNGEGYVESSVYISDYLSVLRRITEHSQNIAESLI